MPVVTAVPVTAVAVPTVPVSAGHRTGAGGAGRLLTTRRRRGRGGRGYGDGAFGKGGRTGDQGAGGCNGDEASGGAKLFSHVVSLLPELARDPSSIGALVVLYSFQYPAVISRPNNAKVRSL